MPRLTLTWTQEQINAAKSSAYAIGFTVSEYLWRCFSTVEEQKRLAIKFQEDE